MTYKYKIYILNGEDSVALAHDYVAANDAAAVEEAFSYTGAYGVEVWQECRLVVTQKAG